MIKRIYNILISPAYLSNYLKNILYLNLTNTEYASFPRISGTIIRRGRGKLIIGKFSTITSSFISNPVGLSNKTAFYIFNGAEIVIGDNVGISNVLLFSMNSIKIEDDVMIGGGCQIFDTDFHSLSYEERVIKKDSNIQTKPVSIKKGAFIGVSSIILKGVTIGERSIVAAGSVVTKSIPNDEIWGGNPAKFIKSLK